MGLLLWLSTGCDEGKLPLPEGILPSLQPTAAPSTPPLTKPQDAKAPEKAEDTKDNKDAKDAKDAKTSKATPAKDDASKADGKASESQAKSAPAKEENPFDVANVTSQLGRAQRELDRRFHDFLERRPLGFDLSLATDIWSDLRAQPQRLAAASRALYELGELRFFLLLLPLALALCFTTAFFVLDRQAEKLGQAWSARQNLFFLPELFTPILRGVIMWLSKLSAPGFILLLTYFPIRTIFGPLTWSRLLTDTFWLIISVRAVYHGAEIVLALFLSHLKDEQAELLRSTMWRLCRFFMLATYPMLILRAFDYRPGSIALARIIFELSLSLYLVITLWNKREPIVALMPAEREAGPTYSLLRRTFSQQFHSILLITSGLLLLRLLGYVKASTFLLSRGYGLFGLFLLMIWCNALLRRFITKRVAAHEQNRTQAELWQSVQGLASMLIFTFFSSMALDLVQLYEPFILLLQAPLVTLQTVTFSIYNALSAVVIVGSAALLSKIIRLALNARIYPSFGINVGAAYAVNTLINYMVIVLGFFMVLIALGVNLAALTVVAASLSVGIGFGLQTLTENLISGFILLFGQAVKKGDFVTVAGVYGRVEAVGARSVVVHTVDNYDMLIPSKELVNGSIINWTYRDSNVRLRIPVGVTYNADPRQVQRLLIEAAQEHQHVLKSPTPEVWFVNFGASSIDFQLLLYFDCGTTTPDRIKGELYYLIWDKLKAANIEIPFPQRDLHLRSIQLDDRELDRLRTLRGPQQAPEDSTPALPDKESEST